MRRAVRGWVGIRGAVSDERLRLLGTVSEGWGGKEMKISTPLVSIYRQDGICFIVGNDGLLRIEFCGKDADRLSVRAIR